MIDLSKEELDLIVDGLEYTYLRKIKKLGKAPQRNAKVIQDLRFSQMTLQKILVLRNAKEEANDSLGNETVS